jgi:hypothetical protein
MDGIVVITNASIAIKLSSFLIISSLYTIQRLEVPEKDVAILHARAAAERTQKVGWN